MEAAEAQDFHSSVFERFEAMSILKCGRSGQYRPVNLVTNLLFAQYYEEASSDPDNTDLSIEPDSTGGRPLQ